MPQSSDVRSAAFKTSAPMSPFALMSTFWNNYMTLVDMQRQAFSVPSLRPRALQNYQEGEGEQVIPVPREELQVGKRQVFSTKTIRVSATVKEVPVEEHLDLRSETVFIERRPSTSQPGSDEFQDRLIEVREMHEEPVIAKVVRQNEEVVITKAVATKRATIRDVLRETHVKVEAEAGDDHSRVEREPKGEIALLPAAADKPSRQAKKRAKRG